jgi:D-glycero-alpha-D-manno-heptose-7-phosphate kinase
LDAFWTLTLGLVTDLLAPFMIITRTPFRFTLGGGGTDLPSYYSRYGGMVFSAAIDKYMFIAVNRPIVDDLVRVKYSNSETVETVGELRHELAQAALNQVGISNAIEIISMADIPAGTGLGSSSCYLVGLLNALHALKRDYRSVQDIAETACHLEMNVLNKPVGKQDQYLAAYGGLPVLEISKDGLVKVRQAKIDFLTIDELNRNTLIFYTGQTRSADEILRHQDEAVKKDDKAVTESLHVIKEIGYQILEAIESSNVDRFGLLMDDHWKAKKKLSSKIADGRIDRLYEIAKENGALGGKVTGAGGGGFFVFYTNNRHHQLRRAMASEGLRELRYRFDLEGSKILVNLSDSRGRYEQFREPVWSQTNHDDIGVSGSC